MKKRSNVPEGVPDGIKIKKRVCGVRALVYFLKNKFGVLIFGIKKVKA